MSDRNSGKLYYLRDRGRRAAVVPKKRQEPSRKVLEDGRKPSLQETVWLGRGLLGVAAYLTAYWLAVATGVLSLEIGGDVPKWVWSLFVADVFVGAAAVVGGYELSRGRDKRDLFAVLAAGALICLSLARIAHTFTATLERNLSPGERLEVSAVAACLCIGVWVVSHALRSRSAEH
jgi:hypothetical protein